jgi:acyl-CoA thioesterase
MTGAVTSFAGSHRGLQRLDRGVFEFDSSWGQGRSVFGGVLVAALLREMDALVPEGRGLRAVQVTFVAPVTPGPFEAGATILRRGKAITTVAGRLVAGGAVAVAAVAAFGAGRRTGVEVAPPPRPAAPAPRELESMPYVSGASPVFTKHYEYRWATRLPFTGGPDAHVGGWIRSADDLPVDDAAMVGLIDAWPPPVWVLVTRPAPASSITWQVDVLGSLAGEHRDPRLWWYFDGRAVASHHGYADCEGLLWDPAGRLVATSRQLVAEFTPPPA